MYCNQDLAQITGLLTISITEPKKLPMETILKNINVFSKDNPESWVHKQIDTISMAVDGSCKNKLLTFGLIIEIKICGCFQ